MSLRPAWTVAIQAGVEEFERVLIMRKQEVIKQ